MENQSAILRHKGKTYLLSELTTDYLKKLNRTEKEIITARLEGDSFINLTELEQRLGTDQLMFAGAAISGCSLPNTEMFAKAISDQLIIFINKFGFSEYTLAELLLSMQINANASFVDCDGELVEQIVFSGRCFNVIYISKILRAYKVTRNFLDRKLQVQIDAQQ
jgi:hypothetical protein